MPCSGQNRSRKAGGGKGQDARPQGPLDKLFFPEAALQCSKRFCFASPFFYFQVESLSGNTVLASAFQGYFSHAVDAPPSILARG